MKTEAEIQGNRKFAFYPLKSTRGLITFAVVFFYCLLWAGGIISHLLFGVVASQNWLGAIFLLLAGINILLTARSLREFSAFLIIALFGFTAEFIGLQTGFPFGSYIYTDILGIKFAGVPLVISLAWMTLIVYVREMLGGLNLSRTGLALTGALWITCLDLIIDPLAVNLLSYWQWKTVGLYYGIPLTNFGGWFLVSFIVFYFWGEKSDWKQWLRISTGLSIVLFFTLIALVHYIYLVFFIGCGLCVCHFLISRKPVLEAVKIRRIL